MIIIIPFLLFLCSVMLNCGLTQGFRNGILQRTLTNPSGIVCLMGMKKHDKNYDNLQMLKMKLSKAGQAGLLSYGALNFLYYSSATLLTIRFAKFEVSAVSKLILKQKLVSIASQLSKIVVMVWIGSQVTKIGRLVLAILLAPTAEIALNTVQRRLSLSRNQTFWFLVSGILMGTMVFYVSIIAILSLRLS